MTEFFNDWVYNQGYPTYNITAQNWGIGQVKITVNQTQSNASVNYFEMPVPIRFYDSNGQFYDIVVDNTSNGQEFIVPIPFLMANFVFDVNKNIISRNNTTTLGTSTFQNESTIFVYPNPTTNQITIQMPSNFNLQQVVLYNALGQKVAVFMKNNFSLENLAIGMYTAFIRTSEGTFTKKIVKN